VLGIDAVALRLFSVYGSPQVPKRGSHSWCVAIFMMQRLLGRQSIIYGDGSQIRDFVHVRDVAKAFSAAVLLPEIKEYVVNIGTGIPTKISELYESISHAIHNDTPTVKYISRRQDDPFGGYASNNRAKDCLKWRASIDLREGLQEYLSWLRGHTNLIPSFL
jgi:UDP-glucose 4-epimerase/dTDP-L-rhamnose 4-epimerase